MTEAMYRTAVSRTRRDLSLLLAGFPMMLGLYSVSMAQSNSPTAPDETLLQSGDLVWPKKPNAYVPYIARAEKQSAPEDEAEWNAAKQKFLATVKEKYAYFSDQDIEAIRRLSFADFYAAYAGTAVPNEPQVLQSGVSLYVGHVGIIQVDPDGGKWVIEALADKGVIKRRYGDWLSARPGEWVWLGRLKDQPLAARRSISEEAAKYIGRPYDFWNLDLNDHTAFYCSKLAWMAIFRSLKFAVDGNENPKRIFWFSPKQLLYASPIDRVLDHEQYITR